MRSVSVTCSRLLQPCNVFTNTSPTHLILLPTAHREFESDAPSGQLLVNLAIRIESVVNAASLFLVQHHLQHLAPIFLRSDSLAHDLDRVDDISQDCLVDRSQCSRARSLLGLVGAAAVGALRAWENAAGREYQDMSVGELLFKFAGEALLDLVKPWEEWDGNEDDDCFLAVADFELTSRDELERS